MCVCFSGIVCVELRKIQLQLRTESSNELLLGEDGSGLIGPAVGMMMSGCIAFSLPTLLKNGRRHIDDECMPFHDDGNDDNIASAMHI